MYSIYLHPLAGLSAIRQTADGPLNVYGYWLVTKGLCLLWITIGVMDGQ